MIVPASRQRPRHQGALRAPLLLEKDIQRTCSDLLESDGWRRVRSEYTYSDRKRKSVGELGMADDLFIRYCQKPLAEVLWIEWKRLLVTGNGRHWPRSTQAAIHQSAWHTLERRRGAMTLLAGIDFPASIDGFTQWYNHSGLKRSHD